jgi:predicted solute-binding protein
VPYLNALPLTHGITDSVLFRTPAQLARMLRAKQLDAALVSVTEILASQEYVVLDGVAVASAGEVKSVLLAHRAPLETITEVACDRASLTSAALLRVLLADRGLRPAFVPLESYAEAWDCDAVLLIGDRALEFLQQPGDHRIWDLGAAWSRLTGLPFVYAAWAIRAEAATDSLYELLTEAKRNGLANLRRLVHSRAEFDPAFSLEYLTRNIRFDLGEAEKAGLNHFAKLLSEQGLGPVWAPRYVRGRTVVGTSLGSPLEHP